MHEPVLHQFDTLKHGSWFGEQHWLAINIKAEAVGKNDTLIPYQQPVSLSRVPTIIAAVSLAFP